MSQSTSPVANPNPNQALWEKGDFTRIASTMRESAEWATWESNKAQTWVLEHDGRRYPPKKILSLATGVVN